MQYRETVRILEKMAANLAGGEADGMVARD